VAEADTDGELHMTPATHAVAGEKHAPDVARQPVLTKDEKVLGYEILFGGMADGPASTPNSPAEDRTVVDTLKDLGLDMLCDGRLAFIDCPPDLLLHDAFLALPPDRVVLELPLDITVNGLVIEACKRLKKAGYKIALNHFRKADHREYLLPFADFLKVDTGPQGEEDFLETAKVRSGKPYKMLAQPVNSRPEFTVAAKAGFTLFEGYFFHHAEGIRVRQIPAGQVARMRLLQAISVAEIDFNLIDQLIRQDASLCYRLLRYLNSPLLGFRVPVQNVHHAINLLGERPLIQWIRTATAMSLGQPKCSDLTLTSLVRARFCELIAPKVDHGSADLFLLGMFSLMDVVLETPMEVLVEGLAFDTSTKAALLAIKNGGGTRLSPVLDLTVARERGDWERVATDSAKLKLSTAFINRAYLDAMEWAHELTKAGGSPVR
jgi:c-di-GMP-related signal transduction protein